MRFFLYLNPTTQGPEEDAQALAHSIRDAGWARDNGFAGVCITDHVFSDYNTYGDGFMFAAHIAPQIGDLTILMTVAVPWLHHPMRFAQQASLIDNLTKGRVIIGIGPGGVPQEQITMGRTEAKRQAGMMEYLNVALEQLKRQSGDPAVPFEMSEGEKGLMHTRTVPTPYKKALPRMARGTLSDDGFVWAAQQGWPFFSGRHLPEEFARKIGIYREAARAAGQSATEIEAALGASMMQKLVWVAETDAQAEEEIRPALELMGLRRTNMADGDVAMKARAAARVGGEHRGEAKSADAHHEEADFRKHGMIYGSPETVTRQLKDYEAAGIRGFAPFFWFGGTDRRAAERSMELFKDEVMPHFGDGLEAAAA